jgi:hypothetical protein
MGVGRKRSSMEAFLTRTGFPSSPDERLRVRLTEFSPSFQRRGGT